VSQIRIDEKGVYLTEVKMLNPKQILDRRQRYQRKIISLRDDIADLQIRIRNHQNQIQSLESDLKAINSEQVTAYIEKYNREKEEATLKALQLLHEVLGNEIYEKLESSKWCTFIGKDGGEYRITNGGHVSRKINGEWKKICLIRPTELPLPDFVLSAFINVRENPQKYNLRYRR
jgi:uncharacterized protein VirK/YbjX